jgi:hypothetical protein
VSGRIFIHCATYLLNTGGSFPLAKLANLATGNLEEIDEAMNEATQSSFDKIDDSNLDVNMKSHSDLESCLDVLRDVSSSGNLVEHEWTAAEQPRKYISMIRVLLRVLTDFTTWHVSRKNTCCCVVQLLEDIVCQVKLGVS